MSKNEDKISKALYDKGYMATTIKYEPISGGVEMCGPEGGWFIAYGEMDGYAPDGFPAHDYITEYNISDVMKTIASLPTLEQIF
ncbi:MAG: hypothetical protein LLG05_18845 [Porphyromonadaceae bacterium]|nr:hypothetical protein [Porphyromonadaceae bacterium]